MRSATWGLLLVTSVGVATPADAQLQWTSKDEKMNFKIGLLGQMQAEMADVAGTVVTYTIDKLVYSPSPPVVFAIVDFDGGGRAPIELTDVDPADVAKVMRQETPEWIRQAGNPIVKPVYEGLFGGWEGNWMAYNVCLLYTSPSPRDRTRSRMPSSA